MSQGVASGPRVMPGFLAALSFRGFALIWTGAFLSSAGTWIQDVALSWIIHSRMGDPFYPGLRSFAQEAPLLAFMLLGGAVADRIDRRRILLSSQLFQMTMFQRRLRNVRLLEMGSVDIGGSGCICPESAMLKTLFTHLLFRREDVLILDIYAGVEHLGRATVDVVDAMIIVVEPTRRSLGTAVQIKKLANDIGLNRLFLVGNKVRNPEEAAFLHAETPGLPVLGLLPADMAVQEADRLGIPVYDHVPALHQAAWQIAETLAKTEAESNKENS